MSRVSAWKEIVSTSFRKEYIFPVNSSKNWFPGHMHKGLKDMQRRILDMDCVIEVHDARIPFSGRNTTFKETISGARPHILVLNKEDLIPAKNRAEIIDKIKAVDPVISEVVFTQARNSLCKGMKSILPKAIKLIENSPRYHRASAPDKTIIVIGIPNVGKSTVINQLRKLDIYFDPELGLKSLVDPELGLKSLVDPELGLKSLVDPELGYKSLFRSVQERIRVSDRPLVYLLDTPGISKPNVKNMHDGLKLAVCNTLNDRVVGEEYICDYLLWFLNSHHYFDYVDYMGLKQPEDDNIMMLAKSALAAGKTRKQTTLGTSSIMPDFKYSSQLFLKGFREGKFGRINLDEDQLNLETLTRGSE
ncbi:mitochondrial GTPase 1 [Eurytemora carolleeae]|uniref:mitochondrial GTPase 1 n=1 Tax=Eurytemora carolleeae TaxID=1294199 RepID=UPI000C782C96|nr:mitochondrial GTPase 1 [Eurytemora carolleeae]|eukprot:XP_023339426.1 mitochondrial GTPase 1-like [Eurytemora affinis]